MKLVKKFEDFSFSRREVIEDVFLDISDYFSLLKDANHLQKNFYSINYGNYASGYPETFTYPELNFRLPTHRNVWVITFCLGVDDYDRNLVVDHINMFVGRIEKFDFECKYESKILSENISIYSIILTDLNDKKI